MSASQLPDHVQPTPPQPPTPPGPDASWYEWHDYRRRVRAYMRAQRWSGAWGYPGRGLLFPVALIVVGAYYLLRSSGLLPGLTDEVFWPSMLILAGVFLVAYRWSYRA